MGSGARHGVMIGFCLAVTTFVPYAEADDESPYTVSKIAVDVSAKNAVAAKDAAMAEAEKRGLNTVLRRVVPFSFYARLPDLQPEQIEGLVNGISIRKEQYSTTRYIATLDVVFNDQGVKQLVANLGAPASEERAPMISILPLTIEGDKVKSANDSWRQAWLDLDLTHGLTPSDFTYQMLLAGRGRHRYLQAPADEHIKRVARIPFAEEDFASGKLDPLPDQLRADGLEGGFVEIA